MPEEGLPERFYRLFAGLTRAHGHFVEAGRGTPGEKVERKRAETVPTGPTVELWARHLRGQYGLGVVPVTDDGLCRWGAIDVDVYDLDLRALRRRVERLKLPLVVLRSKSGGAHLYLFVSPAVPAALMREKLVAWAAALGHAGCEVFPKQTALSSTDDYGNWINMPYFGGNRSLRYAIGPEGALSAEEFLTLAGETMIGPSDLAAIVPETADDPALADWPPCLATLAPPGFSSGQRNNALFNMAVLAKKMDPGNWPALVREFNQQYMTTPLDPREVAGIIKSLEKKDYGYRCKDGPINQACDRARCLTRAYGVAPPDPTTDIVISKIVKISTDPITWLVTIEEHDIAMTTDEMLDQKQFGVRCVEVLHRLPVKIKPRVWEALINGALASVEERAVPEDATPAGQLLVHLERFCTGRAQARHLDELLLGKPHTDEDGRTLFQSTDFLKYLRSQGVAGVNERKVFTTLERHDLRWARVTLKGKPIKVWSVPAFTPQTEAHEPPRDPTVRGDF